MLKEAIRWQWEHRYLWCLIPTPYRDGAFMNIVKRFCGGGGGGDREKQNSQKKSPWLMISNGKELLVIWTQLLFLVLIYMFLSVIAMILLIK